MAEIKYTKNELRSQQNRLNQLEKYLPTLQLKKAMLQLEVSEARIEIREREEEYKNSYQHVHTYVALLTQRTTVEFEKVSQIEKINKRFENIAGVEVPYFESLEFKKYPYSLFETPPWVDQVISGLRGLTEAKVKIKIAEEKKEALEKELRQVTIRVNLFEKILIPRAKRNIKKIKVFLGDQELSAVSQAKVAKAKIEKHKQSLISESFATKGGYSKNKPLLS